MKEFSFQILLWAIIAVYLFTFVPTSLEKLTGGLPDWFKKQFEKTFINKLPGGIFLGFWAITLLESLVATLILIGLTQGEALLGSSHLWIQLGSSVAAFTFACLSFGLRISGDYQGAANTFSYFGVSVVVTMALNYLTK